MFKRRDDRILKRSLLAKEKKKECSNRISERRLLKKIRPVRVSQQAKWPAPNIRPIKNETAKNSFTAIPCA